jgi:hypothetical protein
MTQELNAIATMEREDAISSTNTNKRSSIELRSDRVSGAVRRWRRCDGPARGPADHPPAVCVPRVHCFRLFVCLFVFFVRTDFRFFFVLFVFFCKQQFKHLANESRVDFGTPADECRRLTRSESRVGNKNTGNP